MTRILFLAANPQGASSSRLDKEIRTLEQRIRLSAMRDLFDVQHQLALRTTDLHWTLLQYKPEIVHFAGLGTTSGEIVMEDDSGGSRPVSAEAVSNLFSILRDNLRCVVINACYSEIQARAIVPHIGCVIGMSKMINADSAVCFGAGFYQALGFGRTLRTAFDLACNQIKLEGYADISPVLLTSHSGAADFSFGEHNHPAPASVRLRLNEGGANQRSEFARQLGYLRDPAALPILEERWSQEPDPTVRYWLALALGWIGERQAVRALLRLRESESDQFARGGIDEALRLCRT